MRLDSWKEIARYLQRDESTVQRWEKREGMPVHRHVHEKSGSVYAFSEELDAWREGRRRALQEPAGAPEDGPASIEPPSPSPRRWWIAAAAAVALVTASAMTLRWVTTPPRAASEGVPNLIRLTSTSGLNIDPALSPDGSLLAYASDRPGSADLDIWLQPITGGSPTRITTQPGDELEPSFSPDGSLIAFAKGNSGGIYLVGAVGGEPRLLVEAGRAHTPRFSPDGRRVTYWTGLPPWAVGPNSTATGSLFIVDAAGGRPGAVAPSFAHARYGTWSPDGTKLLFLGQPHREAGDSSLDWYVVDIAGGEPIRTGALKVLRQAGVTGLPVPGGWARDGAVVFATYEEPASNVWELQVSGESGRVAGTPRRLTFGTAKERSPAIGPSGRLVFTSIVANVDVWRLPLDGRMRDTSTALERVTDNAAADVVMNVSADGRTLAFTSSRTGRNEVWLKDLLTQQERQVTYSNSSAGRVRPDGALIALARQAANRSSVDLLPLTGGAASPLCDDCSPVDWSPDGGRLLIQRGGPVRIYITDVATRRETELAAHPTWNLFSGRFSPDGRWVVFHTANTPELRQVYAVPTSATRPVTPDAWIPLVTDFGVQPNWAPDGAGVYHFSLRDGTFCAWLQPVDPATKRPSGEPRPVHHFHHPRIRAAAGAAVFNYIAAGYLYVTLTESTGNVWMLNR